MTVNYRETVVNGNRVQLWGQNQETDSTARRVAAALPRDARVRFVEAHHRVRQACIWYDSVEGPNDEPVTREIPDGWHAVEFDHFSDGTVAVTVEPEGRR